MYPVGRMGAELWRIRKLPKLGFFDEHQTNIRVYPWDIDIFMDLNNGRTLTLYDIPRYALAHRVGLTDLMREKKFGITVAGTAVQYRKRITVWQKITMTARCVGVDNRFVYFEQNCFRGDEACGQALVRMALVKNGIMNPKDFLQTEYPDLMIPDLPKWVISFAESANLRPWPPTRNSK